jgi:hypothetical protein
MVEKILFTEEECKWLLSHAKEYVPSSVSYDTERKSNSTHIYNIKDRLSEEYGLGYPEGKLASFLLEKLKPIGFINLKGTFLNYLKYYKGGFFAKHIDGPERHKTCIIQLTSQDKYLGGDLIVNNKLVSKKIGNTVIFSSNTYHELKKVEKGIRECLVIWTKKGNIAERKVLI